MVGEINGVKPYKPMTLTDALELSEAAISRGLNKLAIQWMKFLTDHVVKGVPDDFPFKISGVYNRLATMYFDVSTFTVKVTNPI